MIVHLASKGYPLQRLCGAKDGQWVGVDHILEIRKPDTVCETCEKVRAGELPTQEQIRQGRIQALQRAEKLYRGIVSHDLKLQTERGWADPDLAICRDTADTLQELRLELEGDASSISHEIGVVSGPNFSRSESSEDSRQSECPISHEPNAETIEALREADVMGARPK